MKQFAMVLLAAATLLCGVGVANAQHGGGGHSGGGGWSGGGGSHGGGSGWHGGGSGWHGGGSGWHGSGWHGGGWRGGYWRGGYWRGGWRGGWGWGCCGWGWGWGWGWGAPWDWYAPYGAWSSYDPSGTTYIQQDAPAYSQRSYSQDVGQQYSYYCPDPAGFYPQVPACNRPWLRVLPSSAPGPAAPAQRY